MDAEYFYKVGRFIKREIMTVLFSFYYFNSEMFANILKIIMV